MGLCSYPKLAFSFLPGESLTMEFVLLAFSAWARCKQRHSQTSQDSSITVKYDAYCLKTHKTRGTMAATIDAPQQWVENIAMLRLPEHADRRLQELMDRNNEGQLTEQELADLAALAELSEQLSLVRAEALHLLGRKP
jgi:hypothetical protein